MTIDFNPAALIPSHEITLPTQPKGYASVLVPLIYTDNQWQLLLTLRAGHLRKHGGEVAFPGGMWEPGDASPADTALREAEEEIGLPISLVSLQGGLDELTTSRATWVRPVVGLLPEGWDLQQLVANEEEIASIFTVPVSFFAQDKRLRTDRFSRVINGRKLNYWVPAYQFGEYEIWGFSAAVIMRLMNQCFAMNIQRENPAPEKIW